MSALRTVIDVCTDPACEDEMPHGYSPALLGYEGCPAHVACTDPDCEYRRIHLDRIDPLHPDEVTL